MPDGSHLELPLSTGIAEICATIKNVKDSLLGRWK
jgi:hypothetical protein